MFNTLPVNRYNKSQIRKFTPLITKYVDTFWWSILSWESKWQVYSMWSSQRVWNVKLTLENFCKTIDPDRWVSKEDLREKKLGSLF
jgi:hypothetical protein